MISTVESNEVENVLIKLFNGDAEGFSAWINDRTLPFVNPFDKQIVESDLETLLECMKAKALRRLTSVSSLSDVPADKPKHLEDGFSFVQEDWTIR